MIPLGMIMLQGRSFKSSLMPAAALALVAVFFLLVRFTVIGTEYSETDVPLLANVLNGASGFSETSATKMSILYHNLRLMLAPWPLVWDRSYNEIPLSNWDSLTPWMGLLSYGILS
ncbi:MAG: hypothetical protein ACK55I_20865, partial [bacterium]